MTLFRASSPAGLFRCSTQIMMGEGCARQVGPEAAKLGGRRALVISDRGVVGAGHTQTVLKSLEAADVDHRLFDAVEPDPSLSVVEAAQSVYREHHCDFLVAVGGGSSMDTAKAVAILDTNPGDLGDYEGIEKFASPPAPLFCVPTTVGTASEVTQYLVITDPARRFKFTIGGRLVPPRMAFLDPLLTLGLPASVTAATGMDALTHAIESYTSLLANPISEGLALHSIRLIGAHLRPAVANSHHVAAMSNMLLAANMAGLAFNNTRLGNVHAMAHPLGAFFHVPHGLANAIMLPHVMEFNLLATPIKMIEIAQALGEPVAGLTEMDAGMRAVEAVRRLEADISIPPRLSDLGVDRGAVSDMARDAMKSGNIPINPRRTTINEIIALYERAL